MKTATIGTTMMRETVGRGSRTETTGAKVRRHVLRWTALLYLLPVLVGPLALVFWRTFENGYDAAWSALTTPETLHAFRLTLIVTAIAVPLNTVFGVACALLIVRRSFPGKGLLNAFVDLPLALSPVVVGLSLFLLYGREGWFGGWLESHDVQVLFALPAMVLARLRLAPVRLPRGRADAAGDRGRAGAGGAHARCERMADAAPHHAAVDPVGDRLRRRADDRALPRGVRRSRGRVGPVQGQTETATLRVEERYDSFDLEGAYAISLVLALLAVLVLIAMTLFQRKEETV